jgi:hypothetical protein
MALISRSRKYVFGESTDGDVRLPQICIPRWTRFAEEVQDEIEYRWGFKAILLDCFGESPGNDQVVAAEVLGQDRLDEWQEKFAWTPFEEIQTDDISDLDRSAIHKLLTAGATGRGPFSRLGWTDELLDWIADETDLARSQFSGEFRHFNAAANHTLIRIGRQDAGALWFKAVGDTNLGEFHFTTALSQFCPSFLPTILATRDDWNGWLMEDAGRSFHEVGSMRGHNLERVGGTLAAMQNTSIVHVDALMADGFRDQRIPVLRAEFAELMPFFEQAVYAQTSPYFPRLEMKRVQEVQTIFDDACCCLEELGIPNALVHNHINIDDILLDGGRCVFTDWTGAAVSNPFVTLELLKLQLAQNGRTAQWIPRLVKAYRQRWRRSISEDQIEKAFLLVPLIAIATQLCRDKERLVSGQRNDPGRQSYIRSLLRQMDQASRSPEMLRALFT